MLFEFDSRYSFLRRSGNALKTCPQTMHLYLRRADKNHTTLCHGVLRSRSINGDAHTGHPTEWLTSACSMNQGTARRQRRGERMFIPNRMKGFHSRAKYHL